MIHACFGVSKNCINHYSYGEICVHCGCCEDIEPNKEKRLNNQIEYYNECIEENNNFSNWDSDEKWRKAQEEDIKKNIIYYAKKIEGIKKQLEQTHLGCAERNKTMTKVYGADCKSCPIAEHKLECTEYEFCNKSLLEHDKKIRADAIDELKTDIINKIDFEDKWLFICKSNNADTNIMFSALKTFVENRAEQLKEQQ